MARLIDDIRAHGLSMPNVVNVSSGGGRKWLAYHDRLTPILEMLSLPVLLIDNVAAYYFEGSRQEFWNIERDFPNLAPPYEVFWVEHKMPHHIRSEEGDSDLTGLNIRVGLLIFGVRREQVKGEGIPDETRWVLAIEVFIDYGMRGRKAEGPHGSIQMAIDENGRLIGDPYMLHFAEPGSYQEEILQAFIGWTHPALLAISFLHCRNVTVEENEVPKPLAKKYEARTGVYPTAYKTLVIEPLRQILRTQGRGDAEGLAKAMHICRGHFKDYRQGRGLFGKYHQMVWHPALVRGTKGAEDTKPERTIEVKL